MLTLLNMLYLIIFPKASLTIYDAEVD